MSRQKKYAQKFLTTMKHMFGGGGGGGVVPVVTGMLTVLIILRMLLCCFICKRHSAGKVVDTLFALIVGHFSHARRDGHNVTTRDATTDVLNISLIYISIFRLFSEQI